MELKYIEETNNKIPKGAKILKKEIFKIVRKIENGYIIETRVELKYSIKDKIDWTSMKKEVYTKNNPFPEFDKTELADKL